MSNNFVTNPAAGGETFASEEDAAGVQWPYALPASTDANGNPSERIDIDRALLLALTQILASQPRMDSLGRQSVIVDSLPTLAAVTTVTTLTTLTTLSNMAQIGAKPADFLIWDLNHLAADCLLAKITRS